jgi:hypothetical protein
VSVVLCGVTAVLLFRHTIPHQNPYDSTPPASPSQ